MTRVGKKAGFNVIRFLGFAVLPLIAGALLGFSGAYYLYNNLLDNIDRECLSQVDIEYGHPVTLDCFFTEIPPNTRFITNVDMIDTGMLATYDIAIDCGGHTVHSILSVVDRLFLLLIGLEGSFELQFNINKFRYGNGVSGYRQEK